jgi:ataxia telangiectasia mutated family protein
MAGLLEWVDDTLPLSHWLISGSLAHSRLRPEDITNREARDEMDAVIGEPHRQRAAYDSVCARFKPVLHHFFLETYPTPPEWYERRLAYTRSVAVNSMVGYIIGLGDRHSSNILIKRGSAELVHIDLGIAFEQGKLLNTPETVPFRLTRDIVDGCGAAGVEGVMRRCCEVTLAVLRANKESLQTLVEVLIHDPILKWTMSPEVARRRQQPAGREDADGDVDAPNDLPLHATSVAPAPESGELQGVVQNADAERALLRVRQKLGGIEDGELRSIEGQVQQLIQDARDPDKLCRLYPGWAAWV